MCVKPVFRYLSRLAGSTCLNKNSNLSYNSGVARENPLKVLTRETTCTSCLWETKQENKNVRRRKHGILNKTCQ